MKIFGHLHRHLDPGDSLGELIFGLIMVLTFTLGARLLEGEEPVDGPTLMIAAIGCNLAWGIIDAFLFVLGRTYERRRVATLMAELRHAEESQALAALSDEFAEGAAAMADEGERNRFYRALQAAAQRDSAPSVAVRPEDIYGAVVVFLLVLATAVPAALPFLLIEDGHLALRVSNAVLVALLFLVGFRWGRHVGAQPWLAGLLVMSLGAALALLAIPLGG